MRLENLRLEAERKEKKKQREHERKARLKAEGKLLTAKQKLDKARAQAMLDALRAQGVDVPEVGEKRPRPGTRIRPNKKKDQLQSQEDQVKDEGENATTDDTAETSENKVEEPVVEKIKDSWDASSSEDESEETKKEEQIGKKDSEVAKHESDDESDGYESEEDSEADDDGSDSEDKSEGETKTDAEAKREKAWERILVSFSK